MSAILRSILLFILSAMTCVSCGDFWVDSQIAQITVTPATPSIVVSNKQQLTAVAIYDNGSQRVLSDAVWASSNVTVAMIEQSGMVTGVSAGAATVSASSGVATGSTTVTVVTSPLTSLLVTPSNPSVSLSAQKTQQFSATATYADGTVQDLTSSVSWTSSNPAVASIATTGLATASSVGTTQIKATSGNTSNSTTLTVVP
jgi:hypothetical protein